MSYDNEFTMCAILALAAMLAYGYSGEILVKVYGIDNFRW
jgi:hypothetical protein